MSGNMGQDTDNHDPSNVPFSLLIPKDRPLTAAQQFVSTVFQLKWPENYNLDRRLCVAKLLKGLVLPLLSQIKQNKLKTTFELRLTGPVS